MIQRNEQAGTRTPTAAHQAIEPRTRAGSRERTADCLPFDRDQNPLAHRQMICQGLSGLSQGARENGPSSPCLPILAWAQYEECDVVRILVYAEEMEWRAGRAASLYVAVARVRVASAVIRADTQGHVAERSCGPWEDFLSLAEPHIRFAVRSSGCRARDGKESTAKRRAVR